MADMNTSIVSVRSVPNTGYKTQTPGRQTAVFMDRDGVFNKVDEHVNTPEQLKAALIPASVKAMAKLSNELPDAKFVLVTNQGGIDAGFMTDEQNREILQVLADEVEAAGGRLDAMFYCPNGKKFKKPEGELDGRKPSGGMLIHGARELGIDLADSYMVGDMSTDIAAGEAAHQDVTTVLVETGFAGKDGKVPFTADHTEKDLSSAVDWIVSREKSLRK